MDLDYDIEMAEEFGGDYSDFGKYQSIKGLKLRD